jgi:toxin ParE1/3/4
MPIDNFIVYFRINEDTATVWITAVVYGKRDQISALRDSSEC